MRDYHKPLEGIDSRGERYHAPNPHVYWTWPLLPDRLRYMPRAYAGVARERGA